MASIKSKICTEVWAEGIVIRPLKETSYSILLNDKLNTGRLSFKAINPEFLLKFGE